MAVTQYIGARYIPLLYTDSNGGNQWEAGVQYDPLTVVTYLNQTYTSKIPVPSSVGDPASNPTYWLLTGAYNAQMANILDEMTNVIEPAIEDLQDPNYPYEHHVILVSDSYGSRQNAASKTWFDIFADKTGAIVEGSIAVAGGGFYTGNLLTGLQSLESGITDPDAITDVVIACGANDIQYSYAGIYSGITLMVTYIRGQYPNAKIWLGHIGIIALDTQMQSRLINSLTAYHDCVKLGVDYIENSEYILHDRDLLDTDATHPVAAGVDAIAQGISSYFMFGYNDVLYPVTVSLAGATGAVTGVTALTSMVLHNDNLMLAGDNTARYFAIAWWNTYASNADNWLNGSSPALTIGHNLAIGNTSRPIIIRATFRHVLSDNSVKYENGFVRFSASSATTQAVTLIAEASTSITNIKQTHVYAGSAVFSAAVV